MNEVSLKDLFRVHTAHHWYQVYIFNNCKVVGKNIDTFVETMHVELANFDEWLNVKRSKLNAKQTTT